MKPSPVLPLLAAATLLTVCPPLTAAEKPAPADLTALLQKGLLEEEGNQNLEAASAAYRELAAAFDHERRLAATALYRLAEIARKQNRRDEAVSLYQRITAEFATCEPMARMSRENLAALGAAAPATPAAAVPPAGTDELAGLRATLKQSPDLINSPDDEGLCPIHRAAREGRSAVVTFLLENKVPVDTLSKTGRTALHFASEAGHKAIAELLVEKGAKVDATVTETVPAKQEAIGTANGSTQWRVLEYGRRIDEATPLHLALLNRRAALAEWLISKGANVNALLKMAWGGGAGQSDDGRRGMNTPLTLALDASLSEIVNLLLTKGADPAVNIVDEYGNVKGTLLHTAAARGDRALIDKLLALGMPIDLAEKDQRPPFSEARDLATLQHLLDKGAKLPPDAAFRLSLPTGGTIRRQAYELLMSRGVDLKTLNGNGESLLTATYLGTQDPDFVNWLLDQGVPAEAGPVPAFDVQKGKAAQVIYDRVTLPKLLRETAITVVLSGEGLSWEALRRQREDETPPSLAGAMDLWINQNMQRNGDAALIQWKPWVPTPGDPFGTPRSSRNSPPIDWSLLTIVRPGPDGKPVRETVKLTPEKAREAPIALPWGSVIELSRSDQSSMSASAAKLFGQWQRTKIAVTIGETRQEFTLPVQDGWPAASDPVSLVQQLTVPNPRARTSTMILRRKTSQGTTDIELKDFSGWPRVVAGDEIIVNERPLNAPSSIERLTRRNLIFLPDRNQWLHGGSRLLVSLRSYPALLAGRDLSAVKVFNILDGEADPDFLQKPEKASQTLDLEKAADAWDEESSVREEEFPEIANAGRIIVLPPAAAGKPGPSAKLLRMIERAPQSAGQPGIPVPRPASPRSRVVLPPGN